MLAAPTSSQPGPPKDSIYTYKKGYYKVSAGKLRNKQSVSSSSAPLPSAVDVSMSKPSSAPMKSKVKPIPFNQYGSNISHDVAFGDHSPSLKTVGGQTTPILLSKDDTPPASPDVFKIHKMMPQDREEMDGRAPRVGSLTMKPLLSHCQAKEKERW
jgi:hypothetical protein